MNIHGNLETDREMQEDIKRTKEKGRHHFLTGLMLGLMLSLFIVCLIFAGDVFNFVRLSLLQKEINVTAGDYPNNEDSVISTGTLQKLKAIEQLVYENYFEGNISEESLEDGLYRGMITALGDPYSEYYSSDELEDMVNKTEGISYGIGAYISLNKEMEMAMISGVMEGSPAEEAGLREGDIIYKVDDESMQGLNVSQVVSHVKGKENTMVHLTIYREGEFDYLEFDLQRRKLIETVTVAYEMLKNDIGFVKIREFDDITLDQYTEAMAVLKESGMKGMILDLRSNPGGNLTTVTEIARKILPKGLIVYTQDRAGIRTEYECIGAEELQIPLVVLINEYSASASEILAGAIQDYEKGTLIGTTTYGKGIVQRIHNLSDGTAVKLTVSAYYTPKGRDIHGIGIVPDIELEFDSETYFKDFTDNQLERAIEVLEGKMSE